MPVELLHAGSTISDAPVCQFGILLKFQNITRTRERHWNHRFDASGLCGHNHDAVAKLHRLVHIMRDEKNRLFVLLPDAQQFFLKQQFVLCVQSRKWLVHEQYLRIVGEGTGNRDTLFHPA